jgi:hypothetical protein
MRTTNPPDLTFDGVDLSGALLDVVVRAEVLTSGVEELARRCRVTREIAVGLLDHLVAVLAAVDQERQVPVTRQPRGGGETGGTTADDDGIPDATRC